MAEDSSEPMLVLQVRLPRQMIEDIDRWRFRLRMRPSRAWTIRWMLENAIEILKERFPEEGEDHEDPRA